MKKAIALIELVFAIVVIGITLLSVPNLLNLSKKTSTNVITQESISNAASQLSMIMSQYWDEVDSSSNYDSPILYVHSGDVELNETKDTNGNLIGRRVGSNQETPRRFGIDENGAKLYASDVLGSDSNDIFEDDIDDFNGQSYTLVSHVGETTTADVGEFKDINITIATAVKYINDSNTYSNSTIAFNNPFNNLSASSSNIKAITVSITSSINPNKKIVFKAFSCNIGASKLKERIFQ
jgi:type II secretory pathway pseudopilin PulG